MNKPVAVLCCAMLGIAACSSDSKKGTTPTPSTTATSVATGPVSTTTLPTATTSASATTAASSATSGSNSGSTSTTSRSSGGTSTTTKSPPTTSASGSTTTDASGSTPSSDGSGTPGTTGTEPTAGAEYTKVAMPTIPNQTAGVHADNTLPDGVYYATVSEDADPAPATGAAIFEIVQLFRGDACTAHFGSSDPDACNDDYGIETDPTTIRQVPLTNQYISIADAATQDSYRISGAELYRLLQGDTPSAGAPDGYLYSAFGFLLTVKGGTVTRLEQWWTP